VRTCLRLGFLSSLALLICLGASATECLETRAVTLKSLHGIAVGQGGEVVKGAVIEIFKAKPDTAPIYSTASDSEGRFTIPALAKGNYWLRARARGWWSVSVPVRVKGSFKSSEDRKWLRVLFLFACSFADSIEVNL